MNTLTLTVNDVSGNSLDEIAANALAVGRRFFGEGPALEAKIVGGATNNPPARLHTHDEFFISFVHVTAAV